MSGETRSRSVDSDLQVAQYLTIGMNLVLVLAAIAVVAGVALGIAILVLGTLSVFVVAVLAYTTSHVVLHQRVAAARERGREQATVLGALSLIRANLVLYVVFVALGVGAGVYFGYL